HEGRNIVEVSAEGADFSEYHVINAKGIDINVKNLSNSVWEEDDALNPGDELEISFDGIKTPLEKIAAIYNPGFPGTCFVRYSSPQGYVRGEGVQYNLSENNALTLTVPASGRVELSGGVIECGHMGDPLGSHRTRPGNEAVYPNKNAVSVSGVYCSLPDITLAGEPGDGDSLGGDGGGGCDAGALALAGMAAFFSLAMRKMSR
ncbi:MAG: hypothetical protein LBS75_04920, partial [Synergistaceae bacterium]|nr:hypothetical protein [Synergistaceae bacterium]